MRTSVRVAARRSGRFLAFAAIPLALAACVVSPGGTPVVPPSGPPVEPPPPREVRPAPFQPAGADLSGVWELIPREDQRPGRGRGPDEGGPPGQARGRERDEGGPPGRAEGQRDREAGAMWAPRRLELRQTAVALAILEQGGVPYSIPFDDRPSVVGDARGVQARLSGVWHGRRFDARIELSNGTVLTEAYELSRDGTVLTIRTRQWEGGRGRGRASEARLVYRRAGPDRR